MFLDLQVTLDLQVLRLQDLQETLEWQDLHPPQALQAIQVQPVTQGILELLGQQVQPATRVALDEQVPLETLELLEQIPPQALLEILDRQAKQAILAIQVRLEVRPLQVPQGIEAIPVVRDPQETLDPPVRLDLQESRDLQILHLESRDQQAIQDPLELQELRVRQDVHPPYPV
jgi:hypothetical protein